MMIPTPTPVEREELATRVAYTGSAEHKDKRSWLGLPKARKNPKADADDTRQNSTICPLVDENIRAEATKWVQHAIRSGHFKAEEWDGEFPRHLWHRTEDGIYWQGRLTQRGAGDKPRGEYKGWPIRQDEWDENFN